MIRSLFHNPSADIDNLTFKPRMAKHYHFTSNMMRPLQRFQKEAFCKGLIIFFILLSACPAAAFIGTFTPRLTVGAEYTDNVFQDNEDNLKRNEENPDKENKDFIYSVSPGFLFQLTGKRSDASLSFFPEYRRYSDNVERSFWRHNAVLSGKIGLYKNTTLNFKDSFLRTEDRLQEESLTVLKNQEPYNQNRAGIWLTHQFGQNDSVTVRYDYNFLKNGDSGGGAQNLEDNSSHSPSFTMTYWLVPGQWGLETGGSYTRGLYDSDLDNPSDDFDNIKGNVKLIKQFNRHLNGFVKYAHTAIHYDGNTENYQLVNPSVGIHYKFTEDTALTLGAGYLMQLKEKSNDNATAVAEIDLQKVWEFRRTSINLNASSGYMQSDLDAENLGLALFYKAGGRAEYSFLKSLSGDIYGSYLVNDYFDIDPEREDRNLTAGLGMTYQAGRWVSSRLDYRFRRLDSTFDPNDFDENRVLLSISVSPPRPYRIFP